MSERVIARQLLDTVPDYKLDYVIAYLQGVTVGEEEPNEDTVKAFLEVDEMKRTGDCQKFNDLNKLWASLEK
ncbi:MAG: hypothetical protein HFH32_09655 [Eubacterium sp.]|jgi:hypothetical protein|nr:hypothetical protein [Eubacterium sp.]